LIEEVYGFNENDQLDALKMLVFRLRQRLKERRAGVDIRSAHGVGYLIAKSST